MLKTFAQILREPWLYKLGGKFSSMMNFLGEIKFRDEILINREIYEEREQRVLDAITFRKEPDRVPVATGGFNFFPAKYAGITCAEYLYDHNKCKAAYLKTINDFEFDLLFPSFFLSMGRLLHASRANLLKLPGRDIAVNSCFQFNEIERLKTEEYSEFLESGIDFLVETIVPRVSDIFSMGKFKRVGYLGRTIFEFLKFMRFITKMFPEIKAKGYYNLITGIAYPPYDIISFIFRDLHGLSRDMMKKANRIQLIELLQRIELWVSPFLSQMAQIVGSNGVFFSSERAFSLSPRQFGQYYWPTLKKIILSMVKSGNIPFLVWESDVTHLVHFLLELPKKISRRCCFMCDTSDIFEVNKILDGHISIMGNVPLSTMCVGTPKDVENYCEKMFAELKPGGGFINCSALGIPDEAKPENIHALIKYTHKYGEYS